jgi:hypothetical protein
MYQIEEADRENGVMDGRTMVREERGLRVMCK